MIKPKAISSVLFMKLTQLSTSNAKHFGNTFELISLILQLLLTR